MMTYDEVRNIMMSIDKNFDGHITREELHIAMRTMGANPGSYVQQYQPPPQNYGMVQQRPTVITIKGNNVTFH